MNDPKIEYKINARGFVLAFYDGRLVEDIREVHNLLLYEILQELRERKKSQ